MITIVVYEKVSDHTKWLEGFNADADHRKGSMGGRILVFDEDPNKHYVILDFTDEGGREFLNRTKTPEMQKVFKDAGVIEQTIQPCSKAIKFNK